ncbi:MAG: SpoIIE family protein phosphatase, partial [Calditrichae bacterium]|nr:SpoIIE family protein phosphatase [Calditrichia bacterium]
LAAPLMAKDKLIGVAEVINRKDGEAFDEEDLKLFSAFCRLVAMAIENARIHQLELDKQRIEQQLEAAKFIQQSFMPETFPTSPQGVFEVSAKSMAAASVGGDFFDFVEFDQRTLGVSIGDVSGKGIPAALFMARLVSDFRLFAQIRKQPAPLLEALNKALCDRSRRGMFVTAQYGILDASTGKFVFANAGHLPIIRIHSKTSEIELLNQDGGIPLGISTDIHLNQG